MTRDQRRTLSTAGALVSLGTLLLGCASGPTPKPLQDASMLIERRESAELAELRPKLMREAEEYLALAHEAYARGDLERANLYAYLAIQRYETARNHVARDSALKLAQAAGASRDEQVDRAATAQQRQAELARFQDLARRHQQLEGSLERSSSKDAAVAEARAALSNARELQARAIGLGAATRAPDAYGEGKVHVESALEQLELGELQVSTQSSQLASSAFQRAIDETRRVVEVRAAPAPTAPSTAASDQRERQTAQTALDDAAVAESAALAARASQTDPLSFQRAVSLRQSAEQRFADGSYPSATRLAREAVNAFRGVAATGPVASDASRAVQAAEDARAGALARGAAGAPDFAQGDYALDTARRALADGDRDRAVQKAREAHDLFVRLVAAPPPPPTGGAGTAGSLAEVARNALVAEQYHRAELLGQLKNETCKGPFQEYDALLLLAQQEYDKGAYARAYEFVLRANERIRRCGTAEAEAVSRATLQAEAERERADAAARQKAAAAIGRAQQTLAEKRIQLGQDARLTGPAELIATAESWYERREYTEAERQAGQAQTRLAALQPQPAAAKPTTAAPTDVAARAAAAKDLKRAQELLATAVGKYPEDPRLAEPRSLVAAAERWYEREAYDQTSALATRASASLETLLAGGGPTAEVKPPGSPPPAESKPAQKPTEPTTPNALVKLCLDARTRIDGVKQDAAKVDRKRMTRDDEEDLVAARAELGIAEEKLEAYACQEALDHAAKADALVEELPIATKAPPPAAKSDKSTKADQRPAGENRRKAKRNAKKADAGNWESAYQAIRRALSARDRAKAAVTPDTRINLARGEDALDQARVAYAEQRYAVAERLANSARAHFESVGGGSAGRVAGGAGGGAAPRSDAAGAGSWKSAYVKVQEALALRDKAADAAESETEKRGVERGKGHLTRAQDAWKSKQFFAAQQAAESASMEFRDVLASVTARAAMSETPGEGHERNSAAFQTADTALRKARVVMAVCEREKCDERDFAQFENARQLLTSANSAFEDKNYPYAENLAVEAKKALDSILGKPKKATEQKPAVDPEAEKKARQAADEALREANVSQKLCEANGCQSLDYEAWLRAQQLLGSAQSSYADKDYAESEKLATQAHETLRSTIAKRPEFKIPEGVTGVNRAGDYLIVQPAIEFGTGGAQIAPASATSIDQLAQVLKANASTLKAVTLLGYTDNRGNAANNRALSGNRARAVLNALVERGVPATLLTSEGRGPENPIADNNTEDGRRANRRVEVRIQAK